MKTPFFAFYITTSPAPFYSVTARPCVVKNYFQTTETVEIELIGWKGTRATSYVNFANVASTPARALAEIERRFALCKEAQATLLPATDEISAVPEMAGAVAG